MVSIQLLYFNRINFGNEYRVFQNIKLKNVAHLFQNIRAKFGFYKNEILFSSKKPKFHLNLNN